MTRDPLPDTAKYYLQQAQMVGKTTEERRFLTKEAYNHVLGALYAEAERADKLKQLNDELVEVLERYAEADHYMDDDLSKVCLAALAKAKEQP